METLDLTYLLLLALTIGLGTVVGMIAGALPGLGSTVTLVLLLPITFEMTALQAILLLLAAYQSSEYGSSISAICLGIPGNAGAAATVLDGYPMARHHSPGRALGFSLAASAVGGLAGGLVLLFLSAPMERLALQISQSEIFLISILGLLAVSVLSSKDNLRSLMSVVLGLMAGTVGMDGFTGASRFTLGSINVLDGLSLIAVITGVFAVTEVIAMVISRDKPRVTYARSELRAHVPVRDLVRNGRALGIGSGLGTLIGIIPGVGTGTSAWISYSAANKLSRTPGEFGKGSAEGIVSAESANNATVGGALLPLLVLGIPGSAAIAVVMGAFIMHGIQPGPQVFRNETDLVYGILFGFLLTTVFMYVVGRTLTPMFSRVLGIPFTVLAPVVLVVSMVGVYAFNTSVFDVGLMLCIGVVFYLLKELDFSVPAFVLAFILSPIIEDSLRRTLILSDGSFSVFFSRGFSLGLLAVVATLLAVAGVRRLAARRARRRATREPVG